MSDPSKSIVIFLFLILTITLAIGCSDATTRDAGPEPDPLPSWTEGPTRSAIVEFVRNVTTEGDPNYVPPKERIATFDNDGTLWSEQPVVQFAYIIYRIALFQLMIHHDDNEREFAYSEKDNASLNAAKENRWFVVNMKSDWKQIFSFQ